MKRGTLLFYTFVEKEEKNAWLWTLKHLCMAAVIVYLFYILEFTWLWYGSSNFVVSKQCMYKYEGNQYLICM